MAQEETQLPKSETFSLQINPGPGDGVWMTQADWDKWAKIQGTKAAKPYQATVTIVNDPVFDRSKYISGCDPISPMESSRVIIMDMSKINNER